MTKLAGLNVLTQHAGLRWMCWNESVLTSNCNQNDKFCLIKVCQWGACLTFSPVFLSWFIYPFRSLIYSDLKWKWTHFHYTLTDVGRKVFSGVIVICGERPRMCGMLSCLQQFCSVFQMSLYESQFMMRGLINGALIAAHAPRHIWLQGSSGLKTTSKRQMKALKTLKPEQKVFNS